MPEETDKLARIARMRRRLWFWPLLLVLYLLFAVWQARRSPYWIAAFGIWWLLAFALSLLALSLTRCPRCGSRFFARRFLPTDRACSSCGLLLKQHHVVYPTLE
jgi:hypothetical protein